MRPDATIALAQRLTMVAGQLTAFGPHVMKATATAASAAGYSGGATSGERVSGGTPGSVTESLALSRDDALTKEHAALVEAIVKIHRSLDDIEAIVRAWQPARALMDSSPCPQHTDDGEGKVSPCPGTLTQTQMSCTKCGMSRSTRTCRMCAKVMKRGQPRRLGMCLKCYRNHDGGV